MRTTASVFDYSLDFVHHTHNPSWNSVSRLISVALGVLAKFPLRNMGHNVVKLAILSCKIRRRKASLAPKAEFHDLHAQLCTNAYHCLNKKCTVLEDVTCM